MDTAQPAGAYAEITRGVHRLITDQDDIEPEVAAYMIARAALITIRARRGADKAAELAYRLADEFAGEDVTDAKSQF